MMPGGFDPLPCLAGPSLRLRPMTGADRAGLIAAAADPAIWAQHPARDRWRPEVAGPFADWLLQEGALIVLSGDRIVGTSRFYPAWNAPGDVAIGYTFLTRDQWGGTANAELKALMLEHAFARVSHVWLHIAADNLRSQRASAKLGSELREQTVHNGMDYNCYAVTQDGWRASPAASVARAAGLGIGSL